MNDAARYTLCCIEHSIILYITEIISIPSTWESCNPVFANTLVFNLDLLDTVKLTKKTVWQ